MKKEDLRLELHDTKILKIVTSENQIRFDCDFVLIMLLNDDGTEFEDRGRTSGALIIEDPIIESPIIESDLQSGFLSGGILKSSAGEIDNLLPIDLQLSRAVVELEFDGKFVVVKGSLVKVVL